jgi:hypothetical protein
VTNGARDGFDREEAKAGKQEQMVQTIPDSNGRPVFDIFRLAPLQISP